MSDMSHESSLSKLLPNRVSNVDPKNLLGQTWPPLGWELPEKKPSAGWVNICVYTIIYNNIHIYTIIDFFPMLTYVNRYLTYMGHLIVY
jgi:hypothetical protein